jgi:ketosteroid isomerase-like protein
LTDFDLKMMADKFLIRELIDEYSNICTRKDLKDLGRMFVDDCVWQTRGTNARSFRGREAVVQAISAVVQGYPLIFQTPHAPQIRVDGDRATATTLMHEIGKLDEENVGYAIAVYHDKLVRTDEGWKFEERVFEGLLRGPC